MMVGPRTSPMYFTDLRDLSNNSDGVGGSNQGRPGYDYISFVNCFSVCILQVLAVDGLALFVGICCMLVCLVFIDGNPSLQQPQDFIMTVFLSWCLLQFLFLGYVGRLVRLWVLPNMILARSR